MSRGDAETPFARWSRLKRAARDRVVSGAEPAADPSEESAQPLDERGAAAHSGSGATDAGSAPGAPEKTDDEILHELGLPNPDDLQPGDDVKGFMAEAVPARLRNRALRKLWASNPILANVDGLVDYGEDFTDAATVVENLATAWQAGRGYRFPEPEPEPEPGPEPGPETEIAPDVETPGADEARPDADAEVMAEMAETAPPDIAALTDAPDQAIAPAPASLEPAALDPEPETALRPRRMRFRFDES